MSKRRKKDIFIVKIFKGIYNIIDKLFITPVSRIIFIISNKLKSNSNRIEKVLNRPHILLYLSLAFAISVFFLVDKQVINLVKNEAEIIANQPISVLYNKEAYVVEGLVDSVDIILTGNKSAIYLAKQLKDHEVVLDLSDYEPSDTPYRVKLTYNQSVDSISYKLDPTYVNVTIKKKVSEKTPISYQLLNEEKLNEKLSVGGINLSKSEVVVKGSKDNLEKIAAVKALVDVSNKDYTEAGTYQTENIPLAAYDKEGNLIKEVEMVPNTVSASVKLDTYKATVPLKVFTNGALVTGKAIEKITVNGLDSFTVDIYGEKSVIDNIGYIPITVDIDGLGNNNSKSFNLPVQKPTGVRYISEKNVKINVSFADEIQKTLNVSVIHSENLNTNLQVNLIESSSVAVQVKGVASIVNNVTEENIYAFVDLTGFGVGDYEVDLKINNNDPRISYVVTSKVKIKITNK